MFTGFTGKERDGETGLDFFGARYLSSAQGRFTSPDPLMASAKTSNPQTWNRYAYALNNPLRFVDPDGMEVPESCSKDQNCTIVAKVNIIYDQTVNRGQGLTKEQKQKFEQGQLAKAQKDYGNSNIRLDVTYTAGTYTVGDDGRTNVTGFQANALNVVVSNTTPNPAVAGTSLVTGSPDVAFTFININDAHNSNAWPLWTNTTEHELAQQFSGDVYQNPNPFAYERREFGLDYEVSRQAAGASQLDFRRGLEPRRYAVPLNPEANTPRQQ